MKILYITNNYLQGGSGAVYASKAFVNSFAALANEMTVVYPFKIGLDATDIDPKVNLVPIEDKRSELKKGIDFFLGILHRYSCEIHKCFDPQKYDLVVFDTSIVTFHLIRIARRVGLKCICIHHNYQIEFIKDDTPWYQLPIMMFWTYFSEREAVKNSNLNLTLTQHDANSLATHYDKKATFGVINVCDFVYKDYKVNESYNKKMQFIITGQLSSLQTENSLIPWIKEYYPILKQVVPNCELTIAGRSPSDRLVQLCQEVGIIIIPSPKDMNPILEKGDVFICPTSLGSGLKLRIMDGLRAGMQVITHERSARGYEKMHELGVLYSYSSKQEFRQSLYQVINNKRTKKDVIERYSSIYSLSSGVERLRLVLSENELYL